MSDLAYIEAYFEKQLSKADMQAFEQQCEQDEHFARDVAFYITTRAAVKQSLLEQKKEQFRALSLERGQAVAAPVRNMPVRRWLPYAAAACLILAVGLYFLTGQQPLHHQVAGYVQEELATMSPTMGLLTDSMEKGKQYLRNKEYNKALSIFEVKASSDNTNDDALLFEGYAYRATKKYDSALLSFHELAGRTQLSINKGPYNEALTLLERNRSGDKKQAEAILQKIVADNLYESKKAAILLSLIK